MSSAVFRFAAPPIFVIIWASGFVVARLVTAHSEPMTFLAVRFAIAAVLAASFARWSRAPWPRTGRAWADTVAIGVLAQALSLAPVFWAVSRGLPSGIAALTAALQPLLTAVLAGPFLGERLSGRRVTGIAIGLAGVVGVLAPKLGGANSYPPAGLAAALTGVLSLTLGTLWQKRAGSGADLRTAVPIQFAASALVTLAAALATETGRFEPVPALWLGLAWSVGGMSIGAMSLLYALLRRGGAVGVASYMFLVPPVASLMAFGLFGETLSPVQWGGMLLAGLGVALATRPDPRDRSD